MSSEEKKVCFQKKELAGSRFRCLLLTHMGREKVYEVLRELSKIQKIKIEFDENKDNYFPKGFTEPKEQMLGNIKDEVFNKILTTSKKRELKRWWLKYIRGNPSTPNWDFISTCKIDDKPGLFLVEAKAHAAENSSAAKTKNSTTNEDNHERIAEAIIEAKNNLEIITDLKFGIQRDRYYQMSNRFAWTWKLADLGIPVVLVYLGFLNAKDMEAKGKIMFKNHNDFVASMTKGDPAKIVDPNAWEKKFEVGDGEKKTPFIALLRSLECNTFVQ
ncbi:MAG: hypothetical protein GX106_07990 [Candidatus Cloacimonetes bacterium]|nr:hypothetical protein [Candidatus Cloacimonadota bacterium]